MSELADSLRLMRPRTIAQTFVNSRGAHGARIPDGLADAEVERSIYQFKLGPRLSAMRKLIATLPEDEQEIWLGKAKSY